MSNKVSIFILIILAILIRILILCNSDNREGSVAMGRVASALCILEKPDLLSNFDANTSMLYHYLLASVLYFWHDPVLAPRVLNVVFGALIVIPFYLLVKILFDKNTAFYSALLLVLHPLHAIYSTISTPDIVFHFFFFSSLYFFFKFRQLERRITWLILSSLLLSISALLRYESWIFIPLLSLLLCKKGKRYSLAFFFLSCIVPLSWLYLCYHYTGNAFYSFIAATRTSQAEILLGRVPYSKHIFGWFYTLSKTLSHIVIVAGLCGIAYAFRKRRFLHLSILFFYIYSIYTINTILSRTWYVDRYTLILGLLILPYAAFFVEKISLLLKLNPHILLLLFLCFSGLESKKIIISHLPVLPRGVREVAAWLGANASASDKVILGTDEWDTTEQDIIVRSGLSQRNFFLVPTSLATPPMTQEALQDYIINAEPRYLILNSGGFLQKVLNFDITKEKIEQLGYIFELLYSQDAFEYGVFNIYKIHYNNTLG